MVKISHELTGTVTIRITTITTNTTITTTTTTTIITTTVSLQVVGSNPTHTSVCGRIL